MQKVPVYGIAEFSEQDHGRSFYANNLRAHLESHLFINTPHKHSTYITILFTRGTGIHQVDFDTFPVSRGSVFLLNPGRVHCWTLSEDSAGYIFFHTGDFYNSIYLNRKIEEFPFFYLSQNHPLIQLNESECNKIEVMFKEVNEEFHVQLPLKNERLGSLVDLIYITLSRLYHGEQQSREHNSYYKIQQLQKLIDEHFRTKKYPKDYADMMNITPRHLSRLCREVLDTTTTELIADRIVLEAKRLLIHNNITVTSVADLLGYEDVSYFSRLFKNKEKVTPKVFQQAIKQ